MAEKRGDLALVELHVEVIDGQFRTFLVDFHQVSDAHTQRQINGFWFNVI